VFYPQVESFVWTGNDLTTKMSPVLGLFLLECFYAAYNKKFSHSHEEVTHKGYEELIQRFEHDVVYPHGLSLQLLKPGMEP